MKKRTAVIAALVSLLPMGQPLVIGTGSALTTAAVMLAVPEKAKAESADFYSKRGGDEWDNKNFYAAIKSYSKAIEIEPNNAFFYGMRGNSYLRLYDYYAAISNYNKSLNIKSNDQHILLFRGVAKKNIGDMKGACADFRKASSLGQELAAKKVREQC